MAKNLRKPLDGRIKFKVRTTNQSEFPTMENVMVFHQIVFHILGPGRRAFQIDDQVDFFTDDC